MRISRLRRQRMYMSQYRRPMPRAQRIVIFILVDVLILFSAFSFTLMQLRPIVLKLATAKVTTAVQLSINDVIEKEFSQGTYDYSGIVTMEKDASGNITALETNMPLINILQSRMSKAILETVKEQMVSEMRIPIGNAIGGIIFSGRGPTFLVKIMSVQNVSTKLVPSSTNDGINQVRYKIMLEAKVDVDVFAPGTRSAPVTVTSNIDVYDTTIVGRVPNVYLGDIS